MKSPSVWSQGYTDMVSPEEYDRLLKAQHECNKTAYSRARALPLVRMGSKWKYISRDRVQQICNECYACYPTVLDMLASDGIKV